jgi:predicted alpha/beta hydrolase family esterase
MTLPAGARPNGMARHILVIHGGDAFDTYDEYLAYLKNKETSLERLGFLDWKRRLGETMGPGYRVVAPQMPNAQNARYAEWKIWFEKVLALLDDGVILVGHSLGGIFLAKYLAETDCPRAIRATFLVAAPYQPEGEPGLADFVLPADLRRLSEQGGTVFLYHSQDDPVVPFADLERYRSALPDDVRVRIFKDRGHFIQEAFLEIVEDIRSVG